ncbi:glycosyltransferase family 2 protein [Novosphingobium album (ex Liu et al. 2023)]|uniref:Glycosyltransferase family 2 protein n=1 Tax=Novosphingobium album (ex Liu et al. 2023) TaxID=3031130 RepID=A0ABT5WQN3_9SPHN|nr:glycosyltransferase family 2 protein [Novosphingobium album (ex Liu et al. 2023)]MDE8652344.1 glycosyltransferase family 2 protein [Novosphingobium album (ex Liu et al. 2023)]
MSRPELSIVIPCFNEAENVRAICDAVTAEARKIAFSHEIVLIDNCSTDGTRAIIRALCAEDANIRAIFNNRNYGQMRSPTYGIYQASGDAVIGMGADFQDPPAMIGPFVRQWREGAQIVLGQRRSERAPFPLGWVRRVGYALLSRFGDYPVIPGATGFGLFDRKVVDALARWHEPEPFFRGMLVESGFRLAVLPFDRPARAAGESKNGFRSLLAFAISALAGSARSLLRMPLLVSILAGLMTLALMFGAVIALAAGGPTMPLAWLAVGTGAFTLVMLSLGLIAEQVRLLAERSRNVPLVIEEERINFPPGAPQAAGPAGKPPAPR